MAYRNLGHNLGHILHPIRYISSSTGLTGHKLNCAVVSLLHHQSMLPPVELGCWKGKKRCQLMFCHCRGLSVSGYSAATSTSHYQRAFHLS